MKKNILIIYQKYLFVSKVISSGTSNNNSYLIQAFLEGKCYYDEEANNLNKEQLENMGLLLAKLHSIKVLDEDNSSWLEDLNKKLEKVLPVLENVFKNDNQKYTNI